MSCAQVNQAKMKGIAHARCSVLSTQQLRFWAFPFYIPYNALHFNNPLSVLMKPIRHLGHGKVSNNEVR